MTLKELEILFALQKIGFNWLVRDKNGDLWVYVNEPDRIIDKWWGIQNWLMPNKIQELFDDIEWFNMKPRNINELLKKYKEIENERG